MPLGTPTSHVESRASVSPSASSSDTGTTRSVPHGPMQEEPAYDVRRELRRRALTRWTLLVAGLAFSAFVVTAAVRVGWQPAPPAAVPPATSASLAPDLPSTPAVPVPIPSAPATVALAPTIPPATNAPPMTPPAPASASTQPAVAVAPKPIPSVAKVATPRPPAVRPKPSASDGSDELFRPWRAN